MTARQLSFDALLPTEAPERHHRPRLDGAYNVFVAGLETSDAKPCGTCEADARCVGPLPVPADSPAEAEAKAAVIAGVDDSACLALPVREGDWSDRLMAMLDAANRRAEEELVELRKMHAEILGCSIDELDARVAADQAARRASAPPKPSRTSSRTSGAVAKGAGTGALPTSRLDERQRELLRLVRVENNVAIYTGAEHIPDWDALKRVIVALGAKWRSRKGFVFSDDVDAAEKIRLALETGEVLDPRRADFFPTPERLADALVAACEPSTWGDDVRILEPSAGRGHIVRAVVRAHPGARITCVELLPDNASVLRASGFDVTEANFLELTPAALPAFDVVAMNPPFGVRADIHHVRHALSFLKPGGRLAAIMSAGVAYRQDRLASEFRALVAEHGGSIANNPDESFLESGTGVRTVTVALRRTA